MIIIFLHMPLTPLLFFHFGTLTWETRTLIKSTFLSYLHLKSRLWLEKKLHNKLMTTYLKYVFNAARYFVICFKSIKSPIHKGDYFTASSLSSNLWYHLPHLLSQLISLLPTLEINWNKGEFPHTLITTSNHLAASAPICANFLLVQRWSFLTFL